MLCGSHSSHRLWMHIGRSLPRHSNNHFRRVLCDVRGAATMHGLDVSPQHELWRDNVPVLPRDESEGCHQREKHQRYRHCLLCTKLRFKYSFMLLLMLIIRSFLLNFIMNLSNMDVFFVCSVWPIQRDLTRCTQSCAQSPANCTLFILFV